MSTLVNLLVFRDFFVTVFYALPIAVVILFFISLTLYLSAKRKNKKRPGSVSEAKMKALTVFFIFSSTLAGVLLALTLSYIGLLFMVIGFM